MKMEKDKDNRLVIIVKIEKYIEDILSSVLKFLTIELLEYLLINSNRFFKSVFFSIKFSINKSLIVSKYLIYSLCFLVDTFSIVSVSLAIHTSSINCHLQFLYVQNQI